MRRTIGILAVAGLAAAATASTSSFTPFASVAFNNKASIDAQGDASNAVDSWVATGGGTVTSIRVTGSLTEVATATWATEAKVRMSAGAGQAFAAFDYTATTTQSYTGTLAVGPTIVPVTAFTLNNGGTVNFEWWESFQDGAADLPEQRWDTVTYEFGSIQVVNGGGSLGTLNNNGGTVGTNGSHVAGGLDFYTFTIASGVLQGDEYLNIAMAAGASGSMTDPEMALYDSNGNLVAASDDEGPGLFPELSFGAADPLAAPDLAAGLNGNLNPGTYTIVTGGFNTFFGATINDIVPGSNAGSYVLNVTYVPAPGALALLGLGGLAAARRRRP